MNARKPLILFSGGLDSTAMLMFAIEQNINATLLHIQYEHPAAQKELQAVQKIAQNFGDQMTLHLHKIEISAETMFIGAGAKGSRFVKGRNLLFVSAAYNLTNKFDCNEIWLGCTKNDFEDYDDCRPDFIFKVNQILNDVELIAPFIQLTRSEIIEQNNVERFDTWSCYEPTDDSHPCGACNSCLQQ